MTDSGGTTAVRRTLVMYETKCAERVARIKEIILPGAQPHPVSSGPDTTSFTRLIPESMNERFNNALCDSSKSEPIVPKGPIAPPVNAGIPAK